MVVQDETRLVWEDERESRYLGLEARLEISEDRKY